MSTTCQLFRQQWLERFPSSEGSGSDVDRAVVEHGERCAECAAWARRMDVQVGMLRSLERLVAPAALDEKVEQVVEQISLGRDLERFEEKLPAERLRALEEVRSLAPKRAPAELEALVANDLAAMGAESPAVRAVRSLSRVRAPQVLERLVEENQADPSHSQAESWVGSLERKRAPRDLASHIDAELGSEGRFGSRSWSGWAAAAAVLLSAGVWWFGFRDGGSNIVQPGNENIASAARPFEIDDQAELVGMARALRDSLTPVAAVNPLVEADETVLPVELRSKRRAVSSSGSAGVSHSGSNDTGGTVGVSGSGSGSVATPTVPQLVQLLLNNPQSTLAHAGDRRIVYFDPADGSFVAYDEHVVTDGLGSYSILPTTTLTPVLPDAQTFRFLMENRQGFIHRYRDFAVRDAATFQRNYTVVPRNKLIQYLGRRTMILDITRRDGTSGFEVWIDVDTALVLGYLSKNADGIPVVWMKYVTLDLAPNVSGVLFHQSLTNETELDPTRPLPFQLNGQIPRLPRLLPDAYELASQSLLDDPDSSQRWIKTTYTDGVQSLFFLERLRIQQQPQTSSGRLPQSSAGDRVILDERGGLATGHARIGNHEFIVAGFVDSDELLDMIESALE